MCYYDFAVKNYSLNLGFANSCMDATIAVSANALECLLHISPCALCAKMRKGALNDYARQIGCNKVAYAHHMDDIIETMFLSMFYEGQFYSFAPVTHLDRSGITVIRPLMYVPEANVIGFLHKYHLPLVKNPCPADGETKREYVKQLVRQINLENPGVKKRIFHAICTGRIEGWNINGKQ